jgi:hypothetical protein
MATVSHFFYEFSVSGGFAPGQSQIVTLGPFDWKRKAVMATAQPFDASSSNRTLSVTSTDMQTTPTQYFHAVVRNTGQDTVFIYYLSVGVVAP